VLLGKSRLRENETSPTPLNIMPQQSQAYEAHYTQGCVSRTSSLVSEQSENFNLPRLAPAGPCLNGQRDAPEMRWGSDILHDRFTA